MVVIAGPSFNEAAALHRGETAIELVEQVRAGYLRASMRPRHYTAGNPIRDHVGKVATTRYAGLQ